MDLLKDVVEKNSDEVRSLRGKEVIVHYYVYGQVPKPQWMGMLEPVLGGVVERLGDSNTRCREAARNTLIMVCLAASHRVFQQPTELSLR